MLAWRGSVRLLTDINQSLLQNASFRCQRVQGLRVGNTEIPNDKKLEVALQYIHGIGRKRAHQILCELSLVNKPTKDLTGIELNSLREEVSKYLTGPDLKRRVKADVQRLVDIECYRGYRHVEGLPCRGQRTSTNARTRKEHQKYGSQEVAERIHSKWVSSRILKQRKDNEKKIFQEYCSLGVDPTEKEIIFVQELVPNVFHITIKKCCNVFVPLTLRGHTCLTRKRHYAGLSYLEKQNFLWASSTLSCRPRDVLSRLALEEGE
ncbi:unnamed protein product [Dovyalis caffra]|uniref:Ribosomal protein S13 n=1 Tax=Dovyalis caffra TaxID=77055 RepID=A0AAV1SAA8_9ROSI|nr:unnamed protein product [Dovyalis caffra]